MGQVLSKIPVVGELASHTWTYYSGLYHYMNGDGRHSAYDINAFAPLRPEKDDSPATLLQKQHARIHLFGLAANFYLYDRPHYRKGSYREDLVDNLRNVAIPGTGFPLSWMAWNKYLALGYLLTIYPGISFIAALHWGYKSGQSSLTQEYATRLLTPNDWFSYWRLNCVLVGMHAVLNGDSVAPDYEMENKWTFLQQGKKLDIPVSPFLQSPAGLVVKHRNEEGGMGIYFYQNAVHGGDWILQERLQNSEWVASLLPENAPLSTFRVITSSKASVNLAVEPKRSDVKALSCVFRAGRAGADTDHVSVLFDVNCETGQILKGTTNNHWYQLGCGGGGVWKTPWRSHHNTKRHPDGNIPVSGETVPNITKMLSLVENAHLRLCPRVPLAGWDVVLSTHPETPICLLEVNLSCNFFRGSFDKKFYFDFIDTLLVDLQEKRMLADVQEE